MGVAARSNKREVSSWKAETTAPSIQKGSELRPSGKVDGTKTVDCWRKGDISRTG
jgi:hypothetical protein